MALEECLYFSLTEESRGFPLPLKLRREGYFKTAHCGPLQAMLLGIQSMPFTFSENSLSFHLGVKASEQGILVTMGPAACLLKAPPKELTGTGVLW